MGVAGVVHRDERPEELAHLLGQVENRDRTRRRGEHLGVPADLEDIGVAGDGPVAGAGRDGLDHGFVEEGDRALAAQRGERGVAVGPRHGPELPARQVDLVDGEGRGRASGGTSGTGATMRLTNLSAGLRAPGCRRLCQGESARRRGTRVRGPRGAFMPSAAPRPVLLRSPDGHRPPRDRTQRRRHGRHGHHPVGGAGAHPPGALRLGGLRRARGRADVALRLAGRLHRRPPPGPGRLLRVRGRHALGADRAGRRRRAAGLPERVPPPGHGAVHRAPARASTSCAVPTTAGPGTWRARCARCRRARGSAPTSATRTTRCSRRRSTPGGRWCSSTSTPTPCRCRSTWTACGTTPTGPASTSSTATPRCGCRCAATGRWSPRASRTPTTCRASTPRCSSPSTTSTPRSGSGPTAASRTSSTGCPVRGSGMPPTRTSGTT